MKLKVNKEGKTNAYNFIDKWEDVTLDKWQQLISVKSNGKGDEAIQTIRILSDMPTKLIKQLSIKDISRVMDKISQLQSSTGTEFTKVFKLDGVEYGFHPNLDDITIGEYADIETLIKNNLEANLHKLMAILFRPVIEREGDVYSIEPYGGDISIRAEKMRGMSGLQVQEAMVFFWLLGKELLKILPLYLMEVSREKMKATSQKVLVRDGDGLA